MRIFGLTAGITAAVLLNFLVLEWKTTIPITVWGMLGVVCLVWSLIRRKEG